MTLPDDIPTLQRMLGELLATVQEEQRRELEQTREQYHLLVQRLYGRKSERFNPHQMLLFDVPVESLPTAPAAPPPSSAPSAQPSKNGHGRRKLSASLPRESKNLDVADAEKTCSDCEKP